MKNKFTKNMVIYPVNNPFAYIMLYQQLFVNVIIA
jgi:hypothetical protein